MVAIKSKNERLQLYQADREFYKERLPSVNAGLRNSRRDLSIAYDYLDTDKTLDEVSYKYNISGERVRQIVAKKLYIVARLSKNLEKGEEIMGHLNKVTQEEFDKVKILLFRGETCTDIAHTLSRSRSVIERIEKAESLKDYFMGKRKYYLADRIRKGKPTIAEVSQPSNRPPVMLNTEGDDDKTPPYIRLEELQLKIATTMAEVIATEVKQRYGALTTEIEQLKAANEAYKKELGKVNIRSLVDNSLLEQ